MERDVTGTHRHAESSYLQFLVACLGAIEGYRAAIELPSECNNIVFSQ
jgi:hypothetical protein